MAKDGYALSVVLLTSSAIVYRPLLPLLVSSNGDGSSANVPLLGGLRLGVYELASRPPG